MSRRLSRGCTAVLSRQFCAGVVPRLSRVNSVQVVPWVSRVSFVPGCPAGCPVSVARFEPLDITQAIWLQSQANQIVNQVVSQEVSQVVSQVASEVLGQMSHVIQSASSESRRCPSSPHTPYHPSSGLIGSIVH